MTDRTTRRRFDPYKNFIFRIVWGGRVVAGFSKVSALKRPPGIVKHAVGKDPATSHGTAGRTKYEPITLERGVTHDADFEEWANLVWPRAGGIRRKRPLKKMWRDLVIEVRDEAGRVAKRYTLRRCWVSEIQALPDLDANANAIAIVRVRLENEGWERDDNAPPARKSQRRKSRT
jgi:phage tail-like protein